MSLENIGNPPLLQTSVVVTESHTITTGNEVRFNDLRKLKSDYSSGRSISAVLPTFFKYFDRDQSEWVEFKPETVEIMHPGPNYIEYLIHGKTSDHKANVKLHVWQVASSDITRVFSNVEIDVLQDLHVDTSTPGNLRWFEMHTFNPMAYKKYDYMDEQSWPLINMALLLTNNW